MVKRKSLPKTRTEAGYAARSEQPVNDTTLSVDQSDDDFQIKPSAPKKATTLSRNKKLKTKAKFNSKVFKEIKILQQSTKLIIPRAPFLRVIREILRSRGKTDMRVTEMAVEALREASEAVLVSLFEDSYLVATHAQRVTLMPRDLALVLSLRNDGLLDRIG